jgi:hypothetical protein
MSQDAQMGYAETANGSVVLTMTRDDYEFLLLAIGYYIGALSNEKDWPAQAKRLFQLANRLNAGNPRWTPCGAGEAPEAGTQ